MYRSGRHASRAALVVLVALLGMLLAPSIGSANTTTIDSISTNVYRGGLTCSGRYLNVGIDASFQPQTSVVPDATATVVGGYGGSDIPGYEASGQHRWHFEINGSPLDGLFGLAQQLKVHVGSYGTGFGITEQTVPFSIPVEPGLIKPATKCLLKNAGVAISGASYIAVLAGPEAIAGVAVKKIFAGLAVASALGSFAANADPPDPDYKTIAQPTAVTLPTLTTGTAEQQAAANAVIAKIGSLLGHFRALLTAAERSWGASDAGDSAWVKVQQQAEQANARAAADDLDAIAAAMAPLQEVLGLNRVDGVLTRIDLGDYQRQIAAGTHSSIIAALDALASRADIRQTIVETLASQDLSGLIGQPYATANADSVPTLENAASGLRAWAASFDARIEPPVVTGISPDSGPASGGAKVTVQGEHLGGATDVLFGSESATAVHCEATDCTVTSPPGSDIQLVTVITPGGRSADNFAARFHYDGAAIAGISPATGPPAGGNRATVNGGPFVAGTQILFGTREATDLDCHPRTTPSPRQLERAPSTSKPSHPTVRRPRSRRRRCTRT